MAVYHARPADDSVRYAGKNVDPDAMLDVRRWTGWTGALQIRRSVELLDPHLPYSDDSPATNVCSTASDCVVNVISIIPGRYLLDGIHVFLLYRSGCLLASCGITKAMNWHSPSAMSMPLARPEAYQTVVRDTVTNLGSFIAVISILFSDLPKVPRQSCHYHLMDLD